MSMSQYSFWTFPENDFLDTVPGSCLLDALGKLRKIHGWEYYPEKIYVYRHGQDGPVPYLITLPQGVTAKGTKNNDRRAKRNPEDSIGERHTNSCF